MWAFSGAMDYLQNAKNPVMTLNYEWSGTPMKVDILSPSSQIYAESNVSLIFLVNRPIDWAGYSLDSEKNVTLWDSHNGNPESANTTLAALPYGTHSLTIYANDTCGDIDNKTVNFTVKKSQTEFVIVISVAVIFIIAIISLLFYKRYHKKIT